MKVDVYYPNTGWRDNDLKIDEAARDYLIWLTDEAKLKGVSVSDFVECDLDGDPNFTDEEGDDIGTAVWGKLEELYPEWENGLTI